MYKLVNLDGKLVCIQKQDGDLLLSIPLDPDNTDYQAYLKWVALGNTPTPADEGAA
jgi:hypothetical protein